MAGNHQGRGKLVSHACFDSCQKEKKHESKLTGRLRLCVRLRLALCGLARLGFSRLLASKLRRCGLLPGAYMSFQAPCWGFKGCFLRKGHLFCTSGGGGGEWFGEALGQQPLPKPKQNRTPARLCGIQKKQTPPFKTWPSGTRFTGARGPILEVVPSSPNQGPSQYPL